MFKSLTFITTIRTHRRRDQHNYVSQHTNIAHLDRIWLLLLLPVVKSIA